MAESDERWAPIPGWENHYEISDRGRLRSVPHDVLRSDGRTARVKGRMRSIATDPKGYKHASLYRDNESKRGTIHRLVMLAFVGPAPEWADVCHNNGDPGDNRLSNLRYDTRSANHLDKRDHGTARWGEDNPRAKLTAADVQEIRRSYGNGEENQPALARRFGVPQQNISSIVHRKTWRHVA